jgi:lipopolysaccharide transport system ATP-binding protein
MTELVIQVRHLSKFYKIRSTTPKPYKSLREDLVDGLKALLKGKWRQDQTEDFWALNDISFDVNQGEVVGIVGRNGAGKSTLLKILSRIVQPTAGEAIIRGRLGSLLEVGTGFHPELTGRENIFMNGAVLGMKRTEIHRRFDEIIAFAEVEKFLDTPVKFYSSGMYVRLAFAVAAHLEPDILIVDEVLAVGDIEFQKKCLGKMGDIAEKQGRTVLFVSHNMSAIRRLCSRAIVIDKGEIKIDGKANNVLNIYLQKFSISNQSLWLSNDRPGNSNFKIDAVKLKNSSGEYTSSICISENSFIEIYFEILQEGARIQFALTLTNNDDECIFSSLSNLDKNHHGKPLNIGKYVSTCCIYKNLLNSSKYYVSLNIGDSSFTESLIISNVIEFNAIDDGILKGDYLGEFAGFIRPKLEWNTHSIDK